MKVWRLLAGLALLAAAASPVDADVANTVHNLSVTGPGTLRASLESQICLFCHTPHSAAPSAALWNRRGSTAVYTPYSSSTTRGGAGQPTGASMQCLSCHDGTIALGELLKGGPVAMSGATGAMPAGRTRLGTDLGDDHPISFSYSATLAAQRNNELVNPATLTGRVKLDAAGQMQCTSCHDPHDNTIGRFLVKSNVASGLCTTCHAKPGWSASSHASSTRTWNGLGTNPWPTAYGTTVAANACESCHKPHTAPGRRHLLHAAAEEGVCNRCHNGNAAGRNIEAEFAKPSRHAMTGTTGTHDAAEPAVVGSMHVECVDCHNPHATRSAAGAVLPGSLTDVRGVTIAGAAVSAATSEYEICLRCHGDSSTRTPAPTITRQVAQGNLRLKFQTTNASYHPVAGVGRSASVPSLISPWTTGSLVTCTSCHSNNAGPGAGGSGPAGPHGSTIRPLLERQYVTTDNTSYSAANYALCFKCHSSASVMGDVSFREHNKHVSGERTPCSVCHDPHGVPAPGTAANNGRLINFDTVVVRPSSGGILRFESTGANRGRCYLTCHGKNHNPLSY